MSSSPAPAAGVVLVPGTHGWRGLSTSGQWWQPGSPFVRMLEAAGVTVLEPYVWTTDISGLWWTGRREWEAAAHGLVTHVQHYGRCEGRVVHVCAHSHGGNVACLAAALGAEIGSLLTVAMPVREDMMPTYYAARHHVRDWLHLYAAGWRDRMQWLGGLMDGRLGVRRHLGIAPLAGHTIADQRLTGVGHGDLLRSSAGMALWQTQGWLDYLREDAQ